MLMFNDFIFIVYVFKLCIGYIDLLWILNIVNWFIWLFDKVFFIIWEKSKFLLFGRYFIFWVIYCFKLFVRFFVKNWILKKVWFFK